jgi:hypothetical protein
MSECRQLTWAMSLGPSPIFFVKARGRRYAHPVNQPEAKKAALVSITATGDLAKSQLDVGRLMQPHLPASYFA